LRYDVNAVVTESFNKKGQLAISFKGYFTVEQA